MATAGIALPFDLTPAVMGSCVAAWLIGLATPGAPAGLGILKAVPFIRLDGVATAPVNVMAVVSRIVTIIGGPGFGLTGLAVKNSDATHGGTTYGN